MAILIPKNVASKRSFKRITMECVSVMLTRDITVTARVNFRFSIAAALPDVTQGPNSSSMTSQIVWRQLQEISQELEEVQYLHPPPLREQTHRWLVENTPELVVARFQRGALPLGGFRPKPCPRTRKILHLLFGGQLCLHLHL
ncbi:hypothetical protein B0H10DRAFT_1955963 [Mycena sp. CBHHK59/15]|nr:hypothetical protein B0H10DRAFT_1955963 [Mycena sp. CBHHK59/15]